MAPKQLTQVNFDWENLTMKLIGDVCSYQKMKLIGDRLDDSNIGPQRLNYLTYKVTSL